MENRKRNNRINFYVSDEEYYLIMERAKTMNTQNNISNYMRRMALEGYTFKINLEHISKLSWEVSQIGKNINQVAKKVNQTGSVHQNDVTKLQNEFKEVQKELSEIFTKFSKFLDEEIHSDLNNFLPKQNI